MINHLGKQEGQNNFSGQWSEIMNLLKENRLEDSLPLIENFLKQEKEIQPEILFELGQSLLKANAPQPASLIFESLIKTDPKNALAHNLLGITLIMRGNAFEAQKEMETAVRLDPDDRPSLTNLAKILMAQQKWSEAVGYLEQSWSLGNNDSQAEEKGLLDNCRANLGQNVISPFNEPVKQSDPYLKLVPPHMIQAKTGLNILIYADFNIAGQLTKLCRALNAFTPHKARCVIVQDDYLQYDKDIIIRDQKGKQVVQDFSEIYDLVNNADFFHIGRQAVNLPDLNFESVLNQDNCLVQYFGSYLRMNHKKLFLWHLKRNIASLVGFGWTQSFPLPRKFYHIQQFFDPSAFKRVPKIKPGEPIRFVHAPTNREIKRTAEFLQALEPLKNKYNLEVDIIEGVSNKECMARKAKGHVTYDEMGTPTFGLNSVESMAMGHVCLSSVNPHVLSYMPDTPVVRITPESIGVMLEKLVSNPELVNAIGDRSYDFVRKYYNEAKSATQFAHLYCGIKYGFFHCDPGLPLEFS